MVLFKHGTGLAGKKRQTFSIEGGAEFSICAVSPWHSDRGLTAHPQTIDILDISIVCGVTFMHEICTEDK